MRDQLEQGRIAESDPPPPVVDPTEIANASEIALFVKGYLSFSSSTEFDPIKRTFAGLGILCVPFSYKQPFEPYSWKDTEKKEIADLARLLREHLAQLGSARIHLVGHSMGGLIILAALKAMCEAGSSDSTQLARIAGVYLLASPVLLLGPASRRTPNTLLPDLPFSRIVSGYEVLLRDLQPVLSRTV